MHKPSGRSLALENATLASGQRTCIRVEHGLIASLDAAPRPADLVIDLRGGRVLPGLINAHDHLQLNGLPRLKYRPRYGNVVEWIDDIRPRLRTEAVLVENHSVPREERLLIGGIKNLLSGVTTVAHHDPLHPALLEDSFPVRVVTRFGWSHSLAIDGEDAILQSFRQTAPSHPWIIHAAEGTDAAATCEFERLDAIGCLASNTVLVHGTGLTSGQHERLLNAGAGLVWCPASNLHLFDRTVDIGSLKDRRHVALGSDSRLSGSRDLLEELQRARECSALEDAELEAMVTEHPSRILRLADRGALRAGTLADIVAIPRDLALCRAGRADISLVLLGGEVSYSDPRHASAFGEAGCDRVWVDGRPKCLARPLVSRLKVARIREAGLDWQPRALPSSLSGVGS